MRPWGRRNATEHAFESSRLRARERAEISKADASSAFVLFRRSSP